MSVIPPRVPSSTYRLQFAAHLRFSDARGLVGYLSELGISDAYPSPLFRARENSSHGYDVIDHAQIDPEFGSEDDFRSFAEELRDRGMGLMMDIVPNHMGIDDEHNQWWQDVLENGISAVHGDFFDIDWYPPKEALRERVLLPFLGDQFGRVLENQELRLVFENDRFKIAYYDARYPLAPRSWQLILARVLEHLGGQLDVDDPQRMELESIVTATDNLPRRAREPEVVQQLYREKEVIRRRLAALLEASPAIRQALEETVTEYNGRRGDPPSFDRLEALLDRQAYRLCHWRVATDEINYRRFFDINALAAIRVERSEVFDAVHAMIFRFLGQGWVTGLRIDHPDGLLDPKQYFVNLQQGFERAAHEGGEQGGRPVEPPLYVAVEKILVRDEGLSPEWAVCGTTGYEFLNLLNGVFIDRRGTYLLRDAYHRFTGQVPRFADVLYQSKRAILGASMSSELHVLAWQLDRISEQHRWSRDFTRSSLRHALREVIACFPAYRTYVGPNDESVGADDRRRILAAVRAAKRRNPEMTPSFFDFIASVLLLEYPEGINESQRQERRQFVLKFQQVSGPVMAKGMEDTAFYRYYPLASLCEVGGDPASAGTSPEQFHRTVAERAIQWPYSMSATATHDTKRGEDTRARLNVLSEVPEVWEQAVRRWHTHHQSRRVEIESVLAPDENEEYLLYQTLVGTWPFPRGDERAWNEYVQRIVAYMDKALKEAKLHTSWNNPHEDYDRAVEGFVRAALGDSEFVDDMERFVRSIADAGFVNSLAQTLTKICVPGVCDFYQGTELWDFSLVDPDNRRPVDFQRRRRLLADLRQRAQGDPAELVAELTEAWPDERIKLFVAWRALELRKSERKLMLEGSYLPLAVEGVRAENVCAFAREHEGRWALCVVPRLVHEACRRPALVGAVSATLGGGTDDRSADGGPGFRDGSFAAWWEDTAVRLPGQSPTEWRNIFNGDALPVDEVQPAGEREGERRLPISMLFRQLPVALLVGSHK
jgi:(1->4)-alpha-D-glucan 1-alpha-D-glucosylmutase